MDKATPVVAIRRADYRAPDWAISEVALDFDLDAKTTRVRARLQVQRTGAADAPLLLQGEALTLISVAVNGERLAADAYQLDEAGLHLSIAGDSAVIETLVEIAPEANSQLMGLYASGGLLCTQCEAEGFRRITYFLDRPDILSRYSVTMTADKKLYPVLLSNGNPVEVRADVGQGKHSVRWEDPHPKPCYLFALVAGDLEALQDEFITQSGRKVALGIWVRKADVARTHHAMAALKQSMAWDEKVYGREYDLDRFNIVAVDDFNFGAMENKGLNIFNSKYILADPETATDYDFDAIAAVVAHEYFHNWTGNRITCRDWFQLSLKEGLTVYRDQEFSADHGSRAVKRIEDVRTLRAAQFPEDAGPFAHPVRPESYIEISNFYTATIYNKGAEVIRMAASLMGPERYRQGTDLYFARHDGQAVTVEDWVRALEEGGQIDLTQFRRWYEQAGTPLIKAEWQQDLEAQSFTLKLSQSLAPTPGQDEKKPMHIPQRVALIGVQSGRQLGAELMVELREPELVVTFEGIEEPALPSLNRGFTAPVRLDADYDRAALAHLSRADSDPFARFEAMQQLALLTLNDHLDGIAYADDRPLIEAMAATLRDSSLDPAFVAEMLMLPSESFIGDMRATVDVEAIHDQREALRRHILTELRDDIWHAYRALAQPAYSASAEARAKRRLRNVLLSLLIADDDPIAAQAAADHYAKADNMTDRMGALGALSASSSAARDVALADFYQRFADNALVIDKWFMLQALSSRADTLAQVKALARHPDYHIGNPNRVRSLLGAFGSNQRRFHEADGSGYAFLAEQVLRLDAINPQTAARIVMPLARWKRFDAARAAKMKAALEQLMQSPNLSRDLYEMVSKGLV